MADVNFSNAFGLLVGVGGSNFETTIKDATDIHKILIDPARAGYLEKNVTLLTGPDATRTAVIKELDKLVEKTNKLDDATVFIFYSGHGGQYKSNATNDTDGYEYFLKTWGYKEADMENTMLNGKIFSQKIATIKAGKLVILLDCCHAAGIKEKTRELIIKDNDIVSDKMILSGTKLIEQLKGGKGRVFISSCADNETSVILPRAENSLFTQVTLEALGGAASGEDALVRVIDLMYHLLREVPARIKKFNHPQNPVINEVTDLNPSYYLCQNSKQTRGMVTGEGVKEKGVAADGKLDFIKGYKQVVIKNEYNQSIINKKKVEKQIIINRNSGDINM